MSPSALAGRRRAADDSFPVQASLLSPEALAGLVQDRYRLASPVRCRLASRSVNDTYQVDAGDATYFLRVSPDGWRTEQEIATELALIDALHHRGLRVAPPVAPADGAAILPLPAPEGERYAVLFAAGGTDVRDIGGHHAGAYGRLAASVHHVADAAPDHRPRVDLDERHLLDEPLAAVRAAMGHAGEDLTYLETMTERVRARLAALPREAPVYGLCHGDLHPGNVRFGPAGEPTLFDFDLCGPGWRVYDLTVFLWNAYGERRPKRWRADRWRAFLRGYRDVRPLDAQELEAVPLFLVARQVWWLGLACAGRSEMPPQWLTPRWFREEVAFLRAWAAEYPILAG